MKVLIVNIDSKIPNLALAKIEKYHRDRGDQITDYQLLANKVDRIYVSCVFSKNLRQAKGWAVYPHAILGGSGFPDVANHLIPEIEMIKPRINLGFTTRGCIRHCPFCIVPAKEGNIRIVGDLLDLWDGTAREIKVLDNNILALPEHFRTVCAQARENKIAVDFNQGLDIRLVNKEIAKELATLRIKTIRFSWDNMADEKVVKKGLKLLSKYVVSSKIMIYVLTGYNTTFSEDMYRRTEINKMGCDAFIMPYHRKSRLINEFASWNNRFKYRNVPFGDYLKMRNNLHLAEGIKICK